MYENVKFPGRSLYNSHFLQMWAGDRPAPQISSTGTKSGIQGPHAFFSPKFLSGIVLGGVKHWF